MNKGFTLAEVKKFPSQRGRARVGIGQKAAFTLAEVLITLGVIGVVSAITMPTLIQNYQKQVTVTQLKKAYSEIAQAIQKAELEHGLMENWYFPKADFNDDSVEQNKYFFENYIKPNLKIIETCIPTSSKCWTDNVLNLKNEKANYISNKQTHLSYITASGYSVYMWMHGTGEGGWYWVDLNGPKKGPNRIGRDIFAFQYEFKGSRFNPAGISSGETITRDMLMGKEEGGELQYLCSKDSGGAMSGGFCSAVIAIDGWKISDDYPW